MAKRTSPSSAAIDAIRAFINSVSILNREERTESLMASLYAIKEGARQEIVEVLKESIVTLSAAQTEVLSKEYDAVIRYCHELIINSSVKTDRTVRIPKELVEFCVKATGVKSGSHILLPYSDNAEFAFALKNCKCRGFAQSKYRWALMQIVLAAYKNPADIRHIGATEGSEEEKNESIKYDFMFSMPPLTEGYAAFNASFIMQMVEQNMLKKDGTVCFLLPIESTTEHEWLSFREILVRNLVMYDVSVAFMPALLRPVIDTDICVWFITKRVDNGGNIMLADVRNERFFYEDEEAEKFIMKTSSIIESINIGEKGVVSFINIADMDSEYRFRVPSLLSMEAMPVIPRSYTYEEGYKVIRDAINTLRGTINDYKVVLYLLHYYRTGLFDSYYSGDTPDSFIASRIHSDFEHRLFQVFSSSLSVFRDHRVLFEEFLVTLGQLDNSWYKKHEARLFDELLSLVQDIEGRKRGDFSQPMALTEFVAKISGYDGKGTLYNPFAGSASYCVTLAGSGRYVAQEMDQTAWAMGVLRLYACGKDPSTFYYEDSIRNWRGLSGIDDVAEHFDCIVATPPFSMKVRGYNLPWAIGDFSFGEDVFIWNCLASIAVSGTAIGVFAHSVITREGKSLELRQRYVDTDILDSVILLPGGVFPSTTIPTIILKFNRNKQRQGFVRIVDGSSFVKKERVHTTVLYDDLLEAIQSEDERYVNYVSIDQIREKGYSLKPSTYLKEEIPVPEGFEKKKLEDLIDSVSGTRPRSSETKGRVVNGGSLSANPFDYLLDNSSLPEEEVNGNFRKISSPVLLLSRVRTLKPTFAQASETEPIFLNPNVLAYRMKEGVNVYIPELIRVLSQVEDIQTGAFVPSINTATIRSIEVVLPKDVSMQEKLYNDAKREFKVAKVRELGLEELMASQKMEFVSIIQRRQHDLNNMLRKVRNACNVISMSVKENGHDAELIDEDSDITVAQAFSSVQSYFDSMSQVINHLADEETYAEPEVIDLIPRLKAIAEQRHRNFTIRYSEDGYALCDVVQDDDEYHAYVKFGSVNLDRVFFNIIQNAEKHGFTDPSRTDYMIDIEISHDYDSSCFVIRFKNNGRPMPEGVDTRRYGRRAEPAGSTGGNGDGGAIVKSTVEHYGGSISVINEPDAWFPVCIELKIPHYDE